MIRAIHIQGFRSIEDVLLPDLKTINILYGPSGVGKTNILDAIALLKAASSYLEASSLVQGGARISHSKFYGTQLSRGQSDKITLCVTASVPGEDDWQYRVSLGLEDQKWQFLEEQVWKGDIQIYTRSGREVRISRETRKARKEEKYTLLPNWGGISFFPMTHTLMDHLRGFIVYRLSLPVLETGVGTVPVSPLGPSGELFSEFIYFLCEQHPERWQAVKDNLRCLHDWIDDVQIAHVGMNIVPGETVSLRRLVTFVDNRVRKTEPIPANLAGKALYSLALLTIAVHPLTHLFFAIDDFGQNADPEAVEELTKIFIRLFLQYSPEKQVILATNISKIGEIASRETEEQVRVFEVERKNKATVVTSSKSGL